MTKHQKYNLHRFFIKPDQKFSFIQLFIKNTLLNGKDLHAIKSALTEIKNKEFGLYSVNY